MRWTSFTRSITKVPAITVTPLKVNTEAGRLAGRDRSPGGHRRPKPARADYAEGTIVAAGHRHRAGARADAARVASRVEPSGIARSSRGFKSYRSWRSGRRDRLPCWARLNNPGRFELLAPTAACKPSVWPAVARGGPNLRQIVVFRRGDDCGSWPRLVNLEGALLEISPARRAKSGSTTPTS